MWVNIVKLELKRVKEKLKLNVASQFITNFVTCNGHWSLGCH